MKKYMFFACSILLLMSNIILGQTTFFSNVKIIEAGNEFSFAIKNDSTVWAWGNNTSGQIGDGSSSYEILTPVQVVGLSNIIAISAGGGHSLALKNDGTVWAWGRNEKGQLGDGTHIDRRTPIQVIVEQ